jgi:O-antigen ligase
MDSIGEVVYDGGYSGISAIYTHSYAASGFTASPYALAALLTVTFACAAAGAALDKSKKRRIFYGISAPIMAAAAFHTLVTPAVIGIACGGIIVLAISIARSISGGGKSAVITAVIICAVAGATGGILFGTDTITLRDEQVIFTDGYVMRSITHNGRDDTSTDIYTYLRDDGLYVAEQNLLTGVGEDTTPYALSTYGLRTDRFYNEYVDMAATRGVPCLVFYGLFLLTALIRMIKNLKSAVKGESFIPAAAAAAVIAYLVQAFFNTSWTTSAPIFYIMLGLAYTSTVHSSQGTVHS